MCALEGGNSKYGGWVWGMSWWLRSVRGWSYSSWCFEACWCDCKRVGHVMGEPCDLLCPGCPQWEQWFSLLDAAGLCVCVPLCITLWSTLSCGIINCSRFLLIALSQSSDIQKFAFQVVLISAWFSFCPSWPSLFGQLFAHRLKRKKFMCSWFLKPCEDFLILDYCSRLLSSQTLMSCTLQDDSMVVSVYDFSLVICLLFKHIICSGSSAEAQHLPCCLCWCIQTMHGKGHSSLFLEIWCLWSGFEICMVVYQPWVPRRVQIL